MTFTATPIFGSEFQESASRFAKDAEHEISSLHTSDQKRQFREKNGKNALNWAGQRASFPKTLEDLVVLCLISVPYLKALRHTHYPCLWAPAWVYPPFCWSHSI